VIEDKYLTFAWLKGDQRKPILGRAEDDGSVLEEGSS